MPVLVKEIILALGALPILYLLFVLFALLKPVPKARLEKGETLPAMTLLKPVCGLEPSLYDNLRSYCVQDYPRYQVIFGARVPDDPALVLVERLIREFPERDIGLVVDAHIVGPNYKVSNLANMARSAKHEIIVVADSDTRVGPDYLRAVAVPFADPSVGGATCLYRGRAFRGVPSALGAMFMNDNYVPSVRLALLLQQLDFCFGQTMAVRRSILENMGGFRAIAEHIADDYMLGQLVVRQGYRVQLVPYVLDNMVYEPSLAKLFRHEVRWARTIRSVRPAGYRFTFVMDALPLALVAFAVIGFSIGGAVVLAGALIARILVHYAACFRSGGQVVPTPWLIPLRDALTFAVRIASFTGNEIVWHGRTLHLEHGGYLAAGLDPADHGAAAPEAIHRQDYR